MEVDRKVKVFFFCKYLYTVFIIFYFHHLFCKYLYIVFIIIIKCKVSFYLIHLHLIIQFNASFSSHFISFLFFSFVDK